MVNQSHTIDKINSLLIKREQDYPTRTKNYFNLINEINTLTDSFLSNKELKNAFHVKKEIEDLKFLENPIFICGAMKCGTSLLPQLFDNHPQIISMLGDGKYYKQFSNFKGNYNELSKHWIQALINPSGKKPFWYFGNDLSIYQDFLFHLDYFINQKIGAYIAVVASIYLSNPKSSSKVKYWLEKNPGNEQYVAELIKMHPKAKFIHIVRDPLINIASVKKLLFYHGKKMSADRYANSLKKSIEIGLKNKEKYGNQYCIVKYEDLVTEPEKTMKYLAKFLDIDFSENLLIPTQNGVLATSNSMYKENRKTGAVTKLGINNKWESSLTDLEKDNIVYKLYDLSLKLGYNHWSENYIKKHKRLRLNVPFNRIISKLT